MELDRVGASLHASTSIAEQLPQRRIFFGHAPHEPRHHAHTVPEKCRVGRLVDVRLDDRRVRADRIRALDAL